MTEKYARLTATPQRIKDGELCDCAACLRDGPHEPDCAVHDEPPADCACDRKDQTGGAG